MRDLGHQLRTRLAIAVDGATTRAEIERRGLVAFFGFVGDHPELYRIIRQAEFVDRESYKEHYRRLAEGYREGLSRAMRSGEVRSLDPEVLAYSLMGVAEILGMRWLLWDSKPNTPPNLVDDAMAFMLHGALTE